ncbi:MAG: hypothetical protein ABS55_03310 [Lautropia sp. SCN 70-15]|nr:MAG: hypothetical protein ABS55_03310 [Lautropia sp. SCN 70-15]
MATVQGWHIVSGDWRALDDDRRRRFWPLVADRIRVALEFEIEAGQVEIDALELPFYRGLRTGAEGQPVESCEFVYELIQVGLPVDIDFVGLKRWCFFLWDGANDLVALDGLSSTIKEFDTRVGVDLGGDGEVLVHVRAAAYLEFFSAFLLGAYKEPRAPSRFDHCQSPFLLLDGAGRGAWVGAAAAAIRSLVAGDDGIYAELLHERPVAAGLEEFDDPVGDFAKAIKGPRRIFRSAAVDDHERSLILVFGRTVFRGQVELAFAQPEGAKWRKATVQMIDDDGGRIAADLPPIFVKSWHRRIAILAARVEALADEVTVRPATFAALLKDSRFRAASRGVMGSFLGIVGSSGTHERDELADLFRLLATRHWGGPLGAARARVMGDLELATSGEEVGTQIELEAPIRVAGHLVFAGVSFVSPVSLAGWQVEGRIDGCGARAMRSLSITEFRVENGIGRVSAQGLGLVEYPDSAVKLDELRIDGSLDLGSLDADGGIALRRAHVGGRLCLAGARLNPHAFEDESRKPSPISAEHLELAGSLEMQGLRSHGPIALKAADIGGDVDLSGASIAYWAGASQWSWASIDLENASIAGDLRINRYVRHGLEPGLADDARVKAIDELAPTLLGGAVDAENARIGGSVLACHCHVLGDLDFRGARIAHNLSIFGLPGATPLPAAVRATVVDGEICAYEASVGGYIHLDGTVCRQIDLNFVDAKALFVHPEPESGAGLPLIVVGLPGGGAGSAACFSLDHARIGGISVKGLRLGAGLRGVGMRVEGDFRLNAADGMPSAFAEALSCAERILEFAESLTEPESSRASRAGAGAIQRFRGEARRLVGEGEAQEASTVLHSRIDGSIRLDGLQCGGNLEMKGIGAGLVQLDGARIGNKFLLADEASAASDGGPGPRAALQEGLRLRNAEVGGATCIDCADVGGPVEIRDSNLYGGLSAVDCRFLQAGSGDAGDSPGRQSRLRINNVRTRSDVRLDGLVASECEISESAIGGDLAFGCDPDRMACPPATGPGPRAELRALRIVANRIEGEIILDRLDVGEGVELVDTRAARGLRVGRLDDVAEAVTCRSLDLTRFGTDADVDLRQLVLRDDDAGRVAAPDTATAAVAGSHSRGIGLPRRCRDDLLLGEEEPLIRAASADRALVAQHATIGGMLLLPTTANALGFADLAFASADRVVVTGDAFADCGPVGVALVLRGARFDSAQLREPLPRRVDLREAAVAHWDIESAGQAATSSRTYLDFVHRSWPYTQAAYTKLEQDYRDGGQHKDADYFLAAAGWRTWRWSMIRPAFDGWSVKLLILLAGVLAAVTALRFGIGWGAATLVVVGTVYALLSPIHDVFKRASRSLIGLFIVAPFQLLYGFGIRWWLPLVLSAVLLVTVTLPVMSDCRNLQVPGVDASTPRTAAAAPGAEGTARGPANRTSLLAALGADIPAGPEVALSCRLRPANASAQEAAQVEWNLGEALWLALRYHLPVVPIDTFFHGERAESVRPSSGPLHLAWAGSDGARHEQPIEWITPIAYARAVYLLSWLVIPFSLIFAAARIQRKFRLQKD